MNLKVAATKLLTNKYFLYAMVFLSVTNMIGYLAMNRVNAVVFFALVGLLTYHFNKNMAIVLLVALVSTNLLMANKQIREGLVDGGSKTDSSGNLIIKTKEEDAKKPKEDSKPKDKDGKPKDASKMDVSDGEPVPENEMANITAAASSAASVDGFEPIGTELTNNNKKGGNGSSSRVDYASTLQESYANLDKILGSDGINKLTSDTQKLMQQQQKLFSTMENMVPMLNDAKKMLSGFDLKNLGDMAGLASSFKTLPTPNM